MRGWQCAKQKGVARKAKSIARLAKSLAIAPFSLASGGLCVASAIPKGLLAPGGASRRFHTPRWEGISVKSRLLGGFLPSSIWWVPRQDGMYRKSYAVTRNRR
jgi:hypothetical protein